MATRVIMPQLGESVEEGTISRWLRHEGEHVSEFEPLVEISTDKVDTEIPAPASGVLLKIYVPEGATVKRGGLLALIGQADEALDESPRPVVEEQPNGGDTAHVETVSAAPVQTESADKGFVTPVVARMVAEHEIDLARVKGTGRGGRITKRDVEAYLAERRDVAAVPSAATAEPDGEKIIAKPAPVPTTAGELVALTPMRRSIAEHMVRSKLHTSPHATTVFEFDMSVVMQHRRANKDNFAKLGVNLTLTAYFAAGVVGALQSNPYLNAQWTEEGIFLHHTVHLGIAVALGDKPSDNAGLIVPVIKNAHELNLMGMARAVNDLAERARSKHLTPDDLRGGTFTITNHGVTGSLFATPIINQPQVGILGVGIVEDRVKVVNGGIVVRPCCFLSLTFDHRIVDGATADAFMVSLKQTLENWA